MTNLDHAAGTLTALANDDVSVAAGLLRLRELSAGAAQDSEERALLRAAVSQIESAAAAGEDVSIAAVFAQAQLEARGASSQTPVDAVMTGASNQTQSDALDADLMAGFVVETLDLLVEAEAAMLSLERNPEDRSALDTLFRCFHTTKGTAGFLGLKSLVEFAHEAETVLDRLRDGSLRLEPHAAELLMRSIDGLVGAIQSLQASGTVGGHQLGALLPAIRSLAQSSPEPAFGSRQSAAETASEAPATSRADSAQDWTRVRTDRLDRLLEAVGEIVVAQTRLAGESAVQLDSTSPLAEQIAACGKSIRELQNIGISMRMVPMRPMFQKIERLIRDLSRRHGKPIDFIATGEDTEIDRNLVDAIGDPLIHLIRNAVDHGIETTEERVRFGKRLTARLELKAYAAGGNVMVEVHDDGKGLDRERIHGKAVALGWIPPDRVLGDSELQQLIFSPGFSTAAQVSELSGRGVGLDVVRAALEAMRGTIEVESEPGSGSVFRLVLPLTLAITDGMIVQVGTQRFILPVLNIQQSFRPTADAVYTVAGRGEVVTVRDEVLPILRVNRLLNVPDARERLEQGILVVVGAAERKCALAVDDLIEQQQVVSRPLGTALGRLPGIAGAAILGDGQVGLILDVAELITRSRVIA